VYKWYTDRNLPVTPVKPDAEAGESVDGTEMIMDVVSALATPLFRRDVGCSIKLQHELPGIIDPGPHSAPPPPAHAQLALPDLAHTSISIIIHPSRSLPILRALFDSARPDDARPWGVWFQPGAADEGVRAFVRDEGLGGRVVLDGCVLVSGDAVREAEGVKGRGKL
jgi:hypothetical protein